MPAAEIAAAVTGIRSALDIAKAMVGLRDAEAFRTKSIELQSVILDSYEKAIEARESYPAQLDRIRALEAEVAHLKSWDAEKEKIRIEAKLWGCCGLHAEGRGTRFRTTALALPTVLRKQQERLQGRSLYVQQAKMG